MRCISLIQPWAWLVTAGPKRIENREWPLPRGLIGQRVLIHASKTDPFKYGDAADFAESAGIDVDIPQEAYEQRGGIVGSVRILGSIPAGVNEHVAGVIADDVARGLDLRWWMRDQHGFILGDPKVLPFTPLRGQPGFFEVGALDFGGIEP